MRRAVEVIFTLLGAASIVAMIALGFASSLVPSLRSGPAHRHALAWIGIIVGLNSIGIFIIAILRGYMDISNRFTIGSGARLYSDDNPIAFSLYALFFVAFGIIAFFVGLHYLRT